MSGYDSLDTTTLITTTPAMVQFNYNPQFPTWIMYTIHPPKISIYMNNYVVGTVIYYVRTIDPQLTQQPYQVYIADLHIIWFSITKGFCNCFLFNIEAAARWGETHGWIGHAQGSKFSAKADSRTEWGDIRIDCEYATELVIIHPNCEHRKRLKVSWKRWQMLLKQVSKRKKWNFKKASSFRCDLTVTTNVPRVFFIFRCCLCKVGGRQISLHGVLGGFDGISLIP